RRGRPWEIDGRPAVPSLDVGAPPSSVEQVEVEKWLPPPVEDAGLLLDDPGPGAHQRQDVGEVVELLGRAVWHGSREFRDDLFGESAEGIPVVRAFTEGDAKSGAPEVAELRDHIHRLLRRPAEHSRATASLAPVRPEDLLATRDPFLVGAEIEADV